MTLETETFLVQLQTQAHKQARLSQSRIFPKQLDSLTSFVGRYSWQVVVTASFLTAAVLKLIKVGRF